MTEMMKAAVITAYGQEKVEIIQTAVPGIGENDVLVKIAAASINPIDLKIRDGKMKLLLHYAMPLILGNDFSGTITDIGKNVTQFKVGDVVFGRPRKSRIGTFAEYLAINQNEVALKPENVTVEEAAAIPLVGLTSYQAFHELMQLKPKDKVLIQAGSGGIGTIAIQLAKSMGAYVATTTSEKNTALVKSLGADKIIDYHKEKFDEVLTEYDYVFDTLGGQALEDAFKIVKPHGKIVSISGMPNRRFAKEYGLPFWKQLVLGLASRKLTKLEKQYQIDYRFLFMKPSGTQLTILKKLIEQEKIRPIIDSVVPFEDIQAALNHSQSGRARGKIIVKLEA